MPNVVTTVAGLRGLLAAARSRGERVALVPTMGSLHEGHLALVRHARTLCPVVVTSIFVNPTQFAPGEDFERYPRDLEGDSRLLDSAGGGIVFAPAVEEIYPPGCQTHVEVERLSLPLCGPFRPGHFRGVATVVLKLLNIVAPDVAVFGEKDRQQLLVIRRLARDLDLTTQIVGHPTVREADGLAMSSRNGYLDPTERARALFLQRALAAGRRAVEGGERSPAAVRAVMAAVLAEGRPDAVDYLAVADPETLEEPASIVGSVILAVAARIGRTRLIDNVDAVAR